MLAAHAGCEAGGRPDHRAGDAWRDRLRRRACATASPCWRGWTPARWTRVYDDLVLAPGARTTVRVLKRLGYRFAIVSGGFSQLTDRLADGPRHRLRRGQRARDRRRQAHRPRGRRRSSTGRARPRHCDASPQQSGLPRAAPRSPSATAPTTSTCSTPPGLGIAFNAKPRRPGGRPRGGERALHGRDALPARDQPRGGRRRRRGGRHHHSRADASDRRATASAAGHAWPTWKSIRCAVPASRSDHGTGTSSTAIAATGSRSLMARKASGRAPRRRARGPATLRWGCGRRTPPRPRPRARHGGRRSRVTGPPLYSEPSNSGIAGEAQPETSAAQVARVRTADGDERVGRHVGAARQPLPSRRGVTRPALGEPTTVVLRRRTTRPCRGASRQAGARQLWTRPKPNREKTGSQRQCPTP